MAELFGRVDGCSEGAAARCTCSTWSAASWAATGSSAATCRSPRASRSRATTWARDDVTLCMFGDGASNQGTFGETLNLAALWRLPVVFMVTNNQFGMGTALRRHSAVTDLQRKGESLGVPGDALRRDGRARHPRACSPRRCGACARSAGRCSSRPSPTASAATRWPTPSSTAPRRRSRSGASATRSRRSASCSSREGVLDAGERASRSTREAIARVDAAVEFAEASPFPAPESLYDDVYVLGDAGPGAGTRGSSARPTARLPTRPPQARADRRAG